MEWLKRLLGIKHKEVDNRCICEMQRDGINIGGWCSKHHTDWINKVRVYRGLTTKKKGK